MKIQKVTINDVNEFKNMAYKSKANDIYEGKLHSIDYHKQSEEWKKSKHKEWERSKKEFKSKPRFMFIADILALDEREWNLQLLKKELRDLNKR